MKEAFKKNFLDFYSFFISLICLANLVLAAGAGFNVVRVMIFLGIKNVFLFSLLFFGLLFILGFIEFFAHFDWSSEGWWANVLVGFKNLLWLCFSTLLFLGVENSKFSRESKDALFYLAVWLVFSNLPFFVIHCALCSSAVRSRFRFLIKIISYQQAKEAETVIQG